MNSTNNLFPLKWGPLIEFREVTSEKDAEEVISELSKEKFLILKNSLKDHKKYLAHAKEEANKAIKHVKEIGLPSEKGRSKSLESEFEFAKNRLFELNNIALRDIDLKENTASRGCGCQGPINKGYLKDLLKEFESTIEFDKEVYSWVIPSLKENKKTNILLNNKFLEAKNLLEELIEYCNSLTGEIESLTRDIKILEKETDSPTNENSETSNRRVDVAKIQKLAKAVFSLCKKYRSTDKTLNKQRQLGEKLEDLQFDNAVLKMRIQNINELIKSHEFGCISCVGASYRQFERRLENRLCFRGSEVFREANAFNSKLDKKLDRLTRLITTMELQIIASREKRKELLNSFLEELKKKTEELEEQLKKEMENYAEQSKEYKLIALGILITGILSTIITVTNPIAMIFVPYIAYAGTKALKKEEKKSLLKKQIFEKMNENLPEGEFTENQLKEAYAKAIYEVTGVVVDKEILDRDSREKILEEVLSKVVGL